MIKMRCSNKGCKHTWFDEKKNLCPKCAAKSEVLTEEVKKIEKVIKNKKPHLK